MLGSKLMRKVHSMTDVTNGGIRGDAFQMAGSSGVRIILDQDAFREVIDPEVLAMLDKIDIDPLGVSIDAILLSVNPRTVRPLIGFFEGLGVKARKVGSVEEGQGVALRTGDGSIGELRPRFREAPYTPIKKLVDQPCADLAGHRARIDSATKEAIKKKRMVLKMLTDGKR